jgi:hypothetical protein
MASSSSAEGRSVSLGGRVGVNAGTEPSRDDSAMSYAHLRRGSLCSARVAVATTIATTLTANYVDVHPGTNTLSGGALTHGFQAAFYVLAGIAVLGAVVAAVLTESRPRVDEAEPAEDAVFAEAA